MLIKKPSGTKHQDIIGFSLDDGTSGQIPYRHGSTKNLWCHPSSIAAVIIFILTIVVVLLPYLDFQDRIANTQLQNIMACETTACGGSLVESIPEGLIFDKGSVSFPSTFDAWTDLINSANESIDIASFYWTLLKNDTTSVASSDWGEIVYGSLVEKGKDKNIKIRIVQNHPGKSGSAETEFLQEKQLAEVRSLDFSKLVGSGILHTKFIIVDKARFYVGSANMDWRSLSQVKELGIVVNDCPCLTEDLKKIFEVYWLLGETDAVVPDKWPTYLSTSFNKETPLDLNFNSVSYSAYLSSSPPSFCPDGRTPDIDALLDVIAKAKKFVYIAVMEYLPIFTYQKAGFWPLIDNAFRSAAMRGVNVRLLISNWKHTRSEIKYFLRSLTDLTGCERKVVIEAKFFKVPSNADQDKIPYARVNHNKYMVTDNTVFIGTSNWSPTYFTSTGGVSFVAQETKNGSLREQLLSVFLRDWFSAYASEIPIRD